MKLLSKIFRGRKIWREPSKSRREIHSCRLHLEALEPRHLLSGTHFDFGSAKSPVAGGYVGVSAAAYSSSTGYGWTDASTILEVVRGTGTSLTRDFHAGQNATFQLDLANGFYLVTPTLGDTTTVRDHMDLYLNDQLVASDINVLKGQTFQPTYQVEVTSGKLTLRLVDRGGVTVRWALAALDVVSAAPSVTIGQNQSVLEGTEVTFSGTAQGNGALSYLWDFGDGATATGTLTPKHAYADNGTYSVSLTATNSLGLTARAVGSVVVTNGAPQAALSGIPVSGITEAKPITVTGSWTDPGAADVAAGLQGSWVVTKNGNYFASASGVARNFSFMPDEKGTYVVTLTATDKDGAASSPASATLVVADTPLRPNALGPYQGTVGAPSHFAGIARDNGLLDQQFGFTYAWNFGDGATAAGATVDHTYLSAGIYTVTLSVTGRNGIAVSVRTSATITATTASEINDFQILSSNLLANTVYGNVQWKEMAASGAWGVNAEWEQGASSKWYIEQQRFGESLIISGLLHDDAAAISAGFKAFDWGFQRQAADGSFSGTQDPFHSVSFFVEAVARACLVIEQSPYASLYQSKVETYTAGVYKAAKWMATPDVWSRGISNDSPYTHRRYLVANALGLTSLLVGGDTALMNLARSQIQNGLSRQLSNGVNPETGGYDSSYQAVGLVYAQIWSTYFPNDSTTSAVNTMISNGLAWEQSRVLSSGEVNSAGNTRTGIENGPSGTVKTIDWRSVATAFSVGFQMTGNSQWQTAAQSVDEYYFKTY